MRTTWLLNGESESSLPSPLGCSVLILTAFPIAEITIGKWTYYIFKKKKKKHKQHLIIKGHSVVE